MCYTISMVSLMYDLNGYLIYKNPNVVLQFTNKISKIVESCTKLLKWCPIYTPENLKPKINWKGS